MLNHFKVFIMPSEKKEHWLLFYNEKKNLKKKIHNTHLHENKRRKKTCQHTSGEKKNHHNSSWIRLFLSQFTQM